MIKKKTNEINNNDSMVEDDLLDLPFSSACERNKIPILQQLQKQLRPHDTVLEIGSGTGQHATFFASSLSSVTWQPSDRINNLATITKRVEKANLGNLLLPIALDVNHYEWGMNQYNAIFSANTLHIMSWAEVDYFLSQVSKALQYQGKLIVYGPFRYGDKFTANSNLLFNQQLMNLDPKQGIRDFNHVNALLTSGGFELLEDMPMPANNQCITWQLK